MKKEGKGKENVEEKGPAKVYSLAKRKRNKRRRKIFKTIVVILLLAIIVFAVRFIPLFNVNNISVEGNTMYESNQIVQVIGVEEGDNAFELFGANIFNMFTFRYRDFEEIIKEEFSYVDRVKVRYRPLGNIKIQITEKEAIGVFKKGNLYIVADREGTIIDFLNHAPKGMIVFKNANFSYEQKKGTKIQFVDPTILDGILELKDAIKTQNEDMYNNISSMVVSSSADYQVIFRGKVKAIFGTLEDLKYKVAFVEETVVKKQGYKVKGILDLTAKIPTFKESVS